MLCNSNIIFIMYLGLYNLRTKDVSKSMFPAGSLITSKTPCKIAARTREDHMKGRRNVGPAAEPSDTAFRHIDAMDL